MDSEDKDSPLSYSLQLIIMETINMLYINHKQPNNEKQAKQGMWRSVLMLNAICLVNTGAQHHHATN